MVPDFARTGLQSKRSQKQSNFNKNKTKNMTTLPLRKSSGRSPWRLAFLLIPLTLASFALSPASLAQLPSPAPDGGYPNNNTAEGDSSLFSLTTGTDNTANGYQALFSLTTGVGNTAMGFDALHSNTIGFANTAVGWQALFNYNNTNPGDPIGQRNTAIGYQALYSNVSGGNNTATGAAALSNTTGINNIALGFAAGGNLTIGDSNIDIGNEGVAGDANTIRIGTQETQTRTFIAGIHGTALGSGVAVRVNANGRLGIAPSSERFKQNIKPMDKASETVLALKPVTFRYKPDLDPDGVPQFGLVAEEVEKVNPDLVAHDRDGKPYTVRYEGVNAMLLNEFLKEHHQVQELKSTAAKQEATIAKQQKQIEALATGLQKVSDQLELSKPAPRTVSNNQ